jgi:hypothetical protein
VGIGLRNVVQQAARRSLRCMSSSTKLYLYTSSTSRILYAAVAPSRGSARHMTLYSSTTVRLSGSLAEACDIYTILVLYHALLLNTTRRDEPVSYYHS